MAADDFFNRWSRSKAASTADSAPPIPATPPASSSGTARAEAEGLPPPLPTLEDVERLTKESDYSAFIADGVDETVKRSAMKKLFTNPHFNIMDGLDIYIGDYSQPDPIPAAMLAALTHGKALLDPLSQLRHPMMSLIEKVVPIEPDTAPDDGIRASENQLSEKAEDDGGASAPISPGSTPDSSQVPPAIDVAGPLSDDSVGDAIPLKADIASDSVPQPVISNPVRS